MERWRKFTKAEGAAYHAFADIMRRLEWDIHHVLWRGVGLPRGWAEIAEETSAAPGPKERVTLLLDRRVTKFFRATGRGFQGRMNDVLLAFVLARMAGVLKGIEAFELERSAKENGVPVKRPRVGASRANEATEAAMLAELLREAAALQAEAEDGGAAG